MVQEVMVNDIKFKIINNDSVIDSLTENLTQDTSISEICSESQEVADTLKDLNQNILSHDSDVIIYTNS